MTDYVAPGLPGSKATFKARYDHWIGGEYVKPQSGQYFENVTPVTGKVFCEIARGNATHSFTFDDSPVLLINTLTLIPVTRGKVI